MVRRFTPFLLAALALSVANPLSAAPPAPPPREVATSSGTTAVISIPVIVASLEKWGVPVPKMPSWVPLWQTYAPGASGPLPPSAYLDRFPQYFPAEDVPTAASKPAPASVPAAKAPARPVGVWVRDIGPAKVVLKVTDDRLTATAIFATGEEVCPVVRVTLDADYAVAKDGTLFGIIFGADATHPMYAAMFQPVAGHPFAFGWRVDGDTLSVRNLKCFGSGLHKATVDEFAELQVLVHGRYTRMDEAKLPEWEKKLTGTAAPLMRTVVGGGLTAPATKPAPSAPPLFRHVPGMCEAPTPVSAAPTVTPQPLPAIVPAAVTPSASPNSPVANTLPTSTYPTVSNPLVGTWTRDVGAFRATFKFTPKQLIVHMHVDPTGKKDFQELIFVVEHKLTADGKRFEGTVIGADVKIREGVPLLDANETLRGAREVDGQPVQFEFRIAEGLLLVRNLSVGTDGKSCSLLTITLPGVYTWEAEKAGPVVEKPAVSATTAPASAAPAERTGCKVETRGPVPVLPPLRGGALPDAPPPPCIHDVLNALPPVPQGVPLILEVSREDLELTAWIVKELETDKLDPPRFYPLVGHAQLHYATWKCTVTFTETITSEFPFPFKTTRERVEVVRVHQNSLYKYEVPAVPAAPPVEPAKVSNGAGSVVPAGGVAPANPLHGTWVREQDGMQVVLTFTEKRLHLELNAALAMPGEKGPPVRFAQSLDADYSTGPDGTVFGVLTGTDLTLGEGLPAEAYASVKEARQAFEKMAGAMFKFRTRSDGGRLTLSEVRACVFESVRGPAGGVKADTSWPVGEYFGGRFERVTGKVPPPKPTAGGLINQYSEDPNVRIEQLHKPDELRQIGEERRRFWNNDMPTQVPMPKCKDCAPPLKLTPGGSAPVPPIPMSRG